MRQDDPFDAMEQALFRAARQERTPGDALERTMRAVVASDRRRRVQRSLLMLGGAFALAAGAALVLRGSSNSDSIQAEQVVAKHSTSSVAAMPFRSTPESLRDPKATPSESAGPLRTGLAPSVSSTTLEEERVMLDRARVELVSGRAESALVLLDEYDKVSGGHLTGEATLLRIEALSSSGHASLAAKLAQRLVDSDPKGDIAERARRYMAKPPLGE